ncbi:MAG TPA: carboxypeptidase regulatory-like domain-containing protein [Vicinamibacterales bacterium]|nr:carboxypeptidase regulatory-like domain-containing protein [Vicinamibacterales bacterium]
MIRKSLVIFVLGVLTTAFAGLAEAQAPSASVAGTVSVTGTDGQPFVVPGVTLTLTCTTGDPRSGVSDSEGAFTFADLPGGDCSIVADLQGFKSARQNVALQPGERSTVALQLGLDTLHEEVTVDARADGSESPIEKHVSQISAQVMQMAPIATDRVQDALPLIPGVVRGPDGLLNVNGSRSNQSALTLNSANGTDPVTGEDAIELPIDAVESVQVRGAAYAPEFGLSAGAVTTVETQKAGAAWHATLNDLEPRIRVRGGELHGFESWTPRVTIGGPIVPGKLSVLQSMQYEYSQTEVFGLPPLQSDTKLQTFESFSRADVAISPVNHFTASAMVSPRKTTYAGLNTFNPQTVTSNIRNHNVLGNVSDQIVVGANGLFETRVSLKEFDSTIYPSAGRDPMVLAPDVNTGSYFNDQERTSRRVEWLNTYAFAPLGPAHVFKAGAGVTHETFDGTSTSRPVDIVREDGTLSQQVAFEGAGRLGRDKTRLLGYAQDTWSATPRLTLQYGARYDYDSITGDVNLAPRGSFTAVVSSDGRTVVHGGAGVFYDPIPLNVASFAQMQTRVVTSFDDDGATASGPSVLMPNVVPSALHTPRSVSWNAAVDREWTKNFFVRLGYQQRENRSESVVDVVPLPDGGAATALRTDGSSRYREAQATARYQFHGTDQIVGSYTRSSAFGNLNDFNTFFGNIEDPVIRPDARGPQAWDAPNRVLFWSSISLPRGFAVFPVIDIRNGFPLSNVDADRDFVGPRNAVGRYPTFVSLDAQITKKLRLFHHNATIGLKVFNITDHFNPRDYQGNLASASFGSFNNSVGRTFRGKWIFEF